MIAARAKAASRGRDRAPRASRRAIVVRRHGASVRFAPRTLTVGATLTAALLAAVVLSVMVGEFTLSPGEVVSALVGAGSGGSGFIVLDLRLPRALAALLSGAALGLAGALFQALARNPLVSPDVVGVSGGASLAAVAMIVYGSADAVPLAALSGALIAGAALYVLGGRAPMQIVLVGIGLTALAQAGVAYVLTDGRIFEVATAYVWMVGSVNGRDWAQVWPLALTVTLAMPALLALARRLDALGVGDDLARSFGVGVERTRLGLFALAVVLTGVAVSATGPLGFVAFLAPHVAKALLRTPLSLAGAALCGALLVVLADLAGRMLDELPAGLITSILAAPYFLWLLRR